MKVFGIIVACFFGLASLMLLGTGLNLFVAQPTRVLNKTFDADNVINNYEWYHDALGNYRAKTAQIKEFKDFLADDMDTREEKRQLRIDLAAIQQSCRELANRYNANAGKANRKIFMDKGYLGGEPVPESLNTKECE